MCGKKGQAKKIFQCYVIQGVGTYVERNDIIITRVNNKEESV